MSVAALRPGAASAERGAASGPNARLGYLAVAVSAVLFSAKAVLIKICYRAGVQPIVLMSLRMLFALPFFAAMAWAPRLRKGTRPPPLDRKDILGLAFLGLMGYYLSGLCDMLGLQYVSAGTERLILYVYPTLVVLLSAWIFRKRIDSGLVAALGLSYLGIAMSFGGESLGVTSKQPYLGGFLIFVSAVCYAVFLIVQGRMIHRLGPQRLTAYSMLAASVLVVAQFFCLYPLRALAQPSSIYLMALTLAIFSTVLPAVLLGYGIRAVGAGKAAVVSSVGPVSTFILAAWLLGEKVGILQATGLALVMAGGLRLGLEKKA